MIEKIRQFILSLLGRWRSLRRPQQVIVQQPPGRRQQPDVRPAMLHRIPRPNQRPNPMIRALNEIFAPRHAAEERVVFTTISNEGMVMEKSEEWFREGNSLKTVSKRSVIVSCSGSVLSSPADVKVKCATCGGFDSSLARCAHPECGVALCRLHQKIFNQPSGPVVLCERHYRLAIASYNTWAAFDRTKQKHQRRS